MGYIHRMDILQRTFPVRRTGSCVHFKIKDRRLKVGTDFRKISVLFNNAAASCLFAGIANAEIGISSEPTRTGYLYIVSGGRNPDRKQRTL